MIIVDVIIIVTVTIGNKKVITFSSVIKNVICNNEHLFVIYNGFIMGYFCNNNDFKITNFLPSTTNSIIGNTIIGNNETLIAIRIVDLGNTKTALLVY